MPTSLRDSGKSRVFARHLALSSIAVGVLAIQMLRVWYRPPFFMFDGGWQVLRIVLAVDVVAGPLLTLVVINRAKPELRRDLIIIGVAQIAAFVYGAWVMHAYRPAFVVYADSTFHSVNWQESRQATPQLDGVRRLAAGRASPVMVLAMADTAQRRKIVAGMASGGPSLAHFGELYRLPDPASFEQVARESTDVESADIESLARGDASIAAELARVRAAQRLPRERLLEVPPGCRYGLIMLVFDRDTRTVIDWMT